MSKEIKPKQRIGQAGQSRVKRFITWGIFLGLATGGGIYAYRYTGRTGVEIRSTRSVILTAPQVPSPKITRLAESGKIVNAGDVVVEFDAAQQEQFYLDRSTSVRTVDSEIVQLKATHRITDEADQMNLMTSE